MGQGFRGHDGLMATGHGNQIALLQAFAGGGKHQPYSTAAGDRDDGGAGPAPDIEVA